MKTHLLAAGLLLSLGCAVAPSIDGAPCPCPQAFHCDSARNVCVPGETLSGPGAMMPPAGDPMPPPPAPSDPIEAMPPSCPGAGGPPLRLTPTEYRFTVADLLGVTLAPSELPPEHDGSTGFATAADRVDTEDGLRGLAKLVADRARPKLARPSNCTAGMPDDACGQLFVDGFGVRAFRGPLEGADRAALEAAMAGGLRTGGLTGGMAAVVETALGRDSFLRRREVLVSAGKNSALDAHSLAARLAALAWRSSPDETLLAAAQSQALLSPEELERQTRRMLEDPRGERMFTSFVRDWLDVDEEALGTWAPAPTELPAYSSTMRSAILRSFDDFAKEQIFRQDAPFPQLLSLPTVLANPAMATFYGLAAPASADFQPVPAREAAQVRRGLLTAPAFLAMGGRALESHPIKRSIAVLGALLCTDLPPPPPNVNIPAQPDPSAGVTTRMRFESHRSPGCIVCHSIIDPIGFGLENYDGVGRWRATERSVAIDSAASMPAYDTVPAFSFQGPADLGDYLAASPATRSCFARQWFRYVFGRTDAPADACTIEQIEKALTAGGLRTKAMLVGLARTPAFTSTASPAQPPGK
jgi:hypothetical protein